MNSWVNIFSLVYPVGSIYETTNDALGPNILFGHENQWELIGTRTIGENEEKTIYTYERVRSELQNEDLYRETLEKLIEMLDRTTDENRKQELLEQIEKLENLLK